MKKELYNLLYEWLVCEWDCNDCQYIQNFRDGDRRHPCNQCEGFNRFKIANHLEADLKDKVKQILEITKKK